MLTQEPDEYGDTQAAPSAVLVDALLREPLCCCWPVLLLRPFLIRITFPYLNNLFVIGTVACFGVWVAFPLFVASCHGGYEGLFAGYSALCC
jgi:hypothetical protein